MQPQTQTDYETIKVLAALLGGGLAGSIITFLVNKFSNRIQKMHCHYIDDDVITKIPIITETGEHKNIYTKEFKLINTTNKDCEQFNIIFEFEASSKILKHDTFSKTGKNYFEAVLFKENECCFTIRNFNRKDTMKFKFDIANLNKDEFNITEADCIGFKIILKDKREFYKKSHGKIVRKEEL